MNEALSAALFFLPAGIANMAPVLANQVPIFKSWKTPIDFGKSWGGTRIFGDHKSWRGLTSGVVLAILAGLFVEVLYPDIYKHSAVLSGGILGLGALLGDAIESSVKRRLNIKPGKSWFPFDQTDYIAGGLLFIYMLERPGLERCLWILVIYFGLHLSTSYIGYILKLKDAPL